MGKEKKKMMHLLSENIKPQAFQDKSHLDVPEKFTMLHYMVPPIVQSITWSFSTANVPLMEQ